MQPFLGSYKYIIEDKNMYHSTKSKRKLSMLVLSISAILSTPIFALDGRCISNSNEVAECIGTTNNLTGQAQEAFAFGVVRGKGVIVKNFDYLQVKHLGGTEADRWGGAWSAGIATYGHMIARTQWSDKYKPDARGVYIDNVKIVGETPASPIVGIFHYNNIPFIGGQRDILYIDNVDIDVTNTRIKPFDPQYPSDVGKYVVSAISAENEGQDKSTILNLSGKSTIVSRRDCKDASPCDTKNTDWISSGVRASTLYGTAGINITKDVSVKTYGDSVYGVVASIGHWNNTGWSASLANEGSVTTTGDNAHALRVGSHRNISPVSSVNNTGNVKTSGNRANGILVGGSKEINASNNGIILTTGENSKGIAIQHQSAYEGNVISGNSVINLNENSIIYGGYDQGAGLYLTHKDGTHTIDNKGFLTSFNYRAIYDKGATQGSVSLTNSGNITGYQELHSVNVNVVNQQAGVFDLENFDDDNEGLPVISRFSDKNTGVFNNFGKIKFSQNMSGAQACDVTFTGLQSFYSNQGGVIDLSANNTLKPVVGVGNNNLVGDRFTITNDTNNSTFYSVGGTVRLNVDLTTANKNNIEDRLTDRLIVDKAVSINGQPTLLEIVPTKNSLKPKETVGEGFLVVETKQSDTNAFALAKPLVIKDKEYVLKQVGNNWYLVTKSY